MGIDCRLHLENLFVGDLGMERAFRVFPEWGDCARAQR